jgi:hypothetical protein
MACSWMAVRWSLIIAILPEKERVFNKQQSP